MLIDLLIVAATIGVAVWGYHRGFSAGGLALIGFGAGVVLGSRVAPLILDGGLRDPYAPVLAIPGALILGAVFAAILERFAFDVRRKMIRKPLLDGAVGAVVAAALALVVVWAAGAAAARVDDLRGDLRDSEVIDKLNAVLPPAGPLLRPKTELERLPVIAGPPAGVAAGRQIIKRDPQVKAAAPGVVRVTAVGCGEGTHGSGWIVRNGLVVTNAHVVQGSDDMRVKLRGRGAPYVARAVWYDEDKDLAILVAPGLVGARPLKLARSATAGTLAAVLGYPGGGAYRVSAARIGRTARIPGRRIAKKLVKRRIVSIRAFVRPGNSGGPVVDGRGRVVTTVFAGRDREGSGVGGHTAYGVPNVDVRDGLRRARRLVNRSQRLADTGECDEDS